MNKPYPATLFKKETLKHEFSWELCGIYKKVFFLEHLWTAASETGTENSIGILAPGEELSARGQKRILKPTNVKSIYSFIYLFFNTVKRVEIFKSGLKSSYYQTCRCLTGF